MRQKVIDASGRTHKLKAAKSIRLNRSKGGDAAIFVILTFFGFFMAIPMIYAISQSLKPLDELWMFPPRFLVRNPTFKNFSDLFNLMSGSWVPVSRYIFNTVLISTIGTFGHLMFASMAAYALSKHQFRGRKVIFEIIVLSLMFSGSVTGVPNFLVISRLGLMNTYWALILPAFSSSMGLYLMKQFMEQMIPDSVLEAARIDGSSEFRTFWSIVMPMVKPGWLTLIVFSFQGLWNMGSTNLIQKEQLKTLNYALSQVVNGGVARAGAAAAGLVVMMIVPILMFLVTQSNIIETMSTSGMKD
ncbi:MAG: carbohydrate ABC transporter permease [Acutalibacteraceae bacterium]